MHAQGDDGAAAAIFPTSLGAEPSVAQGEIRAVEGNDCCADCGHPGACVCVCVCVCVGGVCVHVRYRAGVEDVWSHVIRHAQCRGDSFQLEILFRSHPFGISMSSCFTQFPSEFQSISVNFVHFCVIA